MAKNNRVTEAERQRIVELLPTGMSCRQIAKQVGRSHDCVAKIARSVGHKFGARNADAAHEAARAYGSERRAAFAAELFEDVCRLRQRLREPYTVFGFAGKDGLFNSDQLPEPDARGVRDLMTSIGVGMKTLLDIDRHDRGDDSRTAVEEYLVMQKGERPASA